MKRKAVAAEVPGAQELLQIDAAAKAASGYKERAALETALADIGTLAKEGRSAHPNQALFSHIVALCETPTARTSGRPPHREDLQTTLTHIAAVIEYTVKPQPRHPAERGRFHERLNRWMALATAAMSLAGPAVQFASPAPVPDAAPNQPVLVMQHRARRSSEWDALEVERALSISSDELLDALSDALGMDPGRGREQLARLANEATARASRADAARGALEAYSGRGETGTAGIAASLERAPDDIQDAVASILGVDAGDREERVHQSVVEYSRMRAIEILMHDVREYAAAHARAN